MDIKELFLNYFYALKKVRSRPEKVLIWQIDAWKRDSVSRTPSVRQTGAFSLTAAGEAVIGGSESRVSEIVQINGRILSLVSSERGTCTPPWIPASRRRTPRGH
jgi:hypothetical protein